MGVPELLGTGVIGGGDWGIIKQFDGGTYQICGGIDGQGLDVDPGGLFPEAGDGEVRQVGGIDYLVAFGWVV